MKRILILAAEQEELDAAIVAHNAFLGQIREIAQVTFKLCGIGLASATYTITREITTAKNEGRGYDLAVMLGLAGSYNIESFPIGSVALIDKAYIGDLGFDTPCGIETLFETNVLDANTFPFKNGALCRCEPTEDIKAYLKQFKGASAVTKQTFTGSAAKREELSAKFEAEIEDMEGAALHYVCLMEQIPFFQLRSISNEVGERDRTKWNAPLALDSLKKAMLDFFGKIR